jgi:hypothetical protein
MGLISNYSYLGSLLSFTGILLVSIYFMAIRRQKPIVEVLIFLTGVAVICLLYFIWMFIKKPKPLFFETACVAISIVCIVVLVVISYYYDDVFANNNDTSENDKFEKELVNLSENEFITEFKVNANQIKKIDSTKYTYAFSVYVREDTFEKFPSEYNKQYLFYRKDDELTSDAVSGHGTNFGIRLGADRGLFLDYSQQVNGVGKTTFNTALIKSNFPVNTLTKIFVTVDKTLVNIYIDGIILTKQFKINNLKQPSLVNPIEFGNMPAYLANFSYLNHVIIPTSSIMEYLSKTNSIHL